MQLRIAMPRTPGWVDEFKAFIMRGNVVDLAIGIIIGAAFTGVVNSLVKDVFNPVLGLAIGGVDFSNIFVPLNGHHYASLDAAQKAGAPTLNIGVFINAVINFLIIGFAVFWVVKAMSRFVAREQATVPPPPAPQSEVLLEQIRDTLRAADTGNRADPRHAVLLEQIRDTLRDRLPAPSLARDAPSL